MHITVAICTWNRSELLDQTLTQLRNLRIPSGVTWELLVVNNNCTDDTDDVLARHSEGLPLRRLLETKQGHSHARNCAITAAAGDLLLWTDDDVLADPEWLAAYVQAAQDFPEADFFGGEIEPWFSVPPPAWLKQHLYRISGAYVVRRSEPTGTAISTDKFPWGANIAFRTVALKEFPFDTRLGRCGKGMRGGDETDVMHRMLQVGRIGRWVAEAKVQHYVVPARMRPWYVYEYARGLSESDLIVKSNETRPRVFPRWCLRQWVQATAVRLWNSGAKNERWLEALLEAARVHGELTAWRSLSRQPAVVADAPPAVPSLNP